MKTIAIRIYESDLNTLKLLSIGFEKPKHAVHRLMKYLSSHPIERKKIVDEISKIIK